MVVEPTPKTNANIEYFNMLFIKCPFGQLRFGPELGGLTTQLPHNHDAKYLLVEFSRWFTPDEPQISWGDSAEKKRNENRNSFETVTGCGWSGALTFILSCT
jgi:hypothetical protein